MSSTALSSAFPCESKFVEVFGSKIHYIEQGQGEPILFLQGMMLSSYLWRNIIPKLAPFGRCIAVDLIGTGNSDKPDIPYRVFDHIRYIEEFIKVLGLKKITLVLHFWGSVIGFDYAMRHPDNVKGLAFIEAVLRPVTHIKNLSLLGRKIVRMIQNPDHAYKAIIEDNFLHEKVLPMLVMRKLAGEELSVYRQPFLKPEHRKPLLQWAHDLPLPKGPKDVNELVAHYSQQLQKSTHPKLLLYSMPGFFMTMETIAWAREHLPNLKVVSLGEELHCPQEAHPKFFSQVLAAWVKNLAVKNEDRMMEKII